MFARCAAEQANCALQSSGEGNVALATEHGIGVLEIRPGQPEVIEAMAEPLTGDDDAEIVQVGELRQRTRFVDLSEDDVALWAI